MSNLLIRISVILFIQIVGFYSYGQNNHAYEQEATDFVRLDYPQWQDSIVRVMGDHNYPPHEFINENGEPDGFTVDIVKAVAAEMNLKIDIQLKPWAEVRSAIKNGEADMLTGMYKTTKRDEEVDFSIPHFISTYSVFVRDDSEFEIVDDVKDKVVLVQDGDLGHDFVVENSFGGEIITYPDFDEVFEKFSDGIGDCLIHSRLQGIRYLKRNNISDIRVLDESVLQQKYCMAVAEGNEKLLAVLNEGLSILKTNGTYDTIYNKWFGAYEKDPMNWRDFFIYFLWVFLPLLVITLAALLWSYSLKKQVRKKTEALNRELVIKNRIQEELENNRQQLEDQNKKLLYQNHEIARINEELALAKDNAEKNDYQKTAFLANMSHEIRTPMNAIIGFCELLDQDPAEDETSKYTEIIAQSAQRLLHLLNDIIDISKIESGQIGIHKTHVNAERLVNSLVAFYQMQARNKGLNFIFSPDEKYRNFEFSTDEHRVTQVLNNFLSNAFRHTDFGTIEVGYTIRENHSILFWVKDTGKGIDAEEQGQVFERFYQAKTHQAGGAGLGLAIAKSIVEYMGGEIGLESKIGEGSTFWFSLPV